MISAKKHFMNDDYLDILGRTTCTNIEILKRQMAKANKKHLQRKYSAQLRAFALNLHFFSPRAYEYVREKFETCLPHINHFKMVSKSRCFSRITAESLRALSDITKCNNKLLFALMFDEMAIKRHVELDGQKFHGYIDMGTELNDDSLPIAKEAFLP